MEKEEQEDGDDEPSEGLTLGSNNTDNDEYNEYDDDESLDIGQHRKAEIMKKKEEEKEKTILDKLQEDYASEEGDE